MFGQRVALKGEIRRSSILGCRSPTTSSTSSSPSTEDNYHHHPTNKHGNQLKILPHDERGNGAAHDQAINQIPGVSKV